MDTALQKIVEKIQKNAELVQQEDIESFNLWELFVYAIKRYGNAPYLTFGEKQTTLSFSQVADRVMMLSEGLKKIGVTKGTKVALMLPNSPYYALSFWAVLRLGGTIVNMNPLYASKEIEFLVNDSQSNILITVDDEEIVTKIKTVKAKNRALKIVFCPVDPIKGVQVKDIEYTSFASLFPSKAGAIVHILKIRMQGLPKAPIDKNDIAVLQYTGGTTGMPKGAMLLHRNIMANLLQIVPEAISIGLVFKKERFAAVLPFFHIMGLTSELLLGLLVGGELILLPRFNLKSYADMLRNNKPSILIGVPSIYNTLAMSKEVRAINMTHIKIALCGGSSLSAATKDFVVNHLGVKFLEGYGLSETSPLVCFNQKNNVPAGTVGVPILFTQVSIHSIGDDTAEVPKGEIGELWVKGPQVMAGYWNKPEETALVLMPDGWFKTGDMGRVNEYGDIQLVDRIKDLIITNGYNVYPVHVESAISEHPAVAEASVIGVKHGDHGEAPKAYVVLKENQTLTEKDLKIFLREYLANYQIPREIVFLEELPKTFLGKPSKKNLRELAR